eukprot:TRINITY_DN6949_c0_g2_i5.p1 TRINITY_DN6949_c0_g2~~TRINITY_DN6949_c0_g2_i5.p1  ORF type:complete len:258 (+),score=30.15 TRINITY_DN6949_c0_g2_i5:59-832(+)
MHRFSRSNSPLPTHTSLFPPLSREHSPKTTDDAHIHGVSERIFDDESDFATVALLSDGDRNTHTNSPHASVPSIDLGRDPPMRRSSIDLDELIAVRARQADKRQVKAPKVNGKNGQQSSSCCETQAETRTDWVFCKKSFWNKSRWIGLTPFCVTMSLLGWAYYVFVHIQLRHMHLQGYTRAKPIMEITYQTLYWMTILTLFRTSFGDPGYVTDNIESQIQAGIIPGLETKRNGSSRKCRKCMRTKPDRAHHCSSCGK